MKRIICLLICVFLFLGMTACSSNEKSTRDKESVNSSQKNETIHSNDNGVIEKYDKIIHCDLETGIPGSRRDETEGSYYEYYIKNERLVKYIRYRVLPSEWDDSFIKEYINGLKDDGWKKIEIDDHNLILTIESTSDVPEDNNPLDGSLTSILESSEKDSNCYIK